VSRSRVSRIDAWRAVAGWSRRRWATAAGAGLVFAVLVAIPTDLIPNPVFGREIEPTWWSWPALVISSVLGGLLIATYVDTPLDGSRELDEHGRRRGWAGALLTYFAVGCPVCNKIVLLLLGSAGALTWFEPVQPILQILAIGLLLWALQLRLKGELSCPIATDPPTDSPVPTHDNETPVSGGSSHA
jgi:hypothetical protein